MIELVVRTSIILVAAWVGSQLLVRATAATRHLVWHCAIVSVLAVPLLAALLPSLPFPGTGSVSRVVRSIAVARPLAEGLAGQVRNVPVPHAASTNVINGLDLGRTARDLWVAGSMLAAIWFVGAHVAGARGRRGGRPARESIQIDANRLARTLAIRRSVAVVIADEPGPFTCGVRQPTIVLPELATQWTSDQLQAVLLHELAHIRRADCRVQLIAQIACAAYWFNPLVWLAARALRRERERACDDEVLSRGTTPSTYAASLLDIAYAMQSRFASPAVLTMARPSELEGRLLSILATTRAARVPKPATRFAVVFAAALVAVAGANGHAAAVESGNQSPQPAQSERWPGEDKERQTLRLALEGGSEVIPQLVEALADPDSQVREKAALGLGWRNDPRVVDPLIDALQDTDAQVREKAAIALGSTGDSRAAAALQAALNDANGQVREKASAALLMMAVGSDGQTANEVRESLRLMITGLLRLTR